MSGKRGHTQEINSLTSRLELIQQELIKVVNRWYVQLDGLKRSKHFSEYLKVFRMEFTT